MPLGVVAKTPISFFMSFRLSTRLYQLGMWGTWMKNLSKNPNLMLGTWMKNLSKNPNLMLGTCMKNCQKIQIWCWGLEWKMCQKIQIWCWGLEWKICQKIQIWCWGFEWKICQKIQILLKLDENICHFTWSSVWVSRLPATLDCNKSALLNKNLIRLLGQSRR